MKWVEELYYVGMEGKVALLLGKDGEVVTFEKGIAVW